TTGAESRARRSLPLPLCRDSIEKTGRRLTSDPIRNSLGLLPSGPDPVGEWLVHRQSPGPYLGPKGAESKRGGRGLRGPTTPRFVKAGLDPAIPVLLFSPVQEKAGMPEHRRAEQRRPSDGYARHDGSC